MSASDYLKNPLVLALVGGGAYLAYRKFYGQEADELALAVKADEVGGDGDGDEADDNDDAEVDESDFDEDSEIAALNPYNLKKRPGGGKLAILRGVRIVGPLTRKIRNKKRKLLLLAKQGPLANQSPENQERFMRLKSELAQLMAERNIKITAKKGEAYTAAKTLKRAEKLKAMVASGKYPQAYIEAIAGTLTLKVGSDQPSEEEVEALVADMSDEEAAQAQQVAQEMSALANRSLFSFYR